MEYREGGIKREEGRMKKGDGKRVRQKSRRDNRGRREREREGGNVFSAPLIGTFQKAPLCKLPSSTANVSGALREQESQNDVKARLNKKKTAILCWR